jgi:hypothetical protein
MYSVIKTLVGVLAAQSASQASAQTFAVGPSSLWGYSADLAPALNCSLSPAFKSDYAIPLTVMDTATSVIDSYAIDSKPVNLTLSSPAALYNGHSSNTLLIDCDTDFYPEGSCQEGRNFMFPTSYSGALGSGMVGNGSSINCTLFKPVTQEPENSTVRLHTLGYSPSGAGFPQDAIITLSDGDQIDFSLESDKISQVYVSMVEEGKSTQVGSKAATVFLNCIQSCENSPSLSHG